MEKIFRAYKLGTMENNTEKIGLGYEIAKDNNRINQVGKYLRWEIDELFQLINVFKGDMSLVGPRPTILCQVKEYNDFQKKRLLVKLGITGWALINGRNKLSWPERIKLDIWYIEHWSFWLDIKILFKTLFVVAKGEGLYNNSNLNKISK